MSENTASPSITSSEPAIDSFTAKVRELMGIGGDHETPALDIAHSEPRGSWGCERDLDLLDWGVLVGIAYATARLQEPEEEEGLVAIRARDAARTINRTWSGQPAFAPRPQFSPLLDQLLTVWRRVGGLDFKYIELNDALNDLVLAFGVPEVIA